MGERRQERTAYTVLYDPSLSFFILILFNLSKNKRRECNGARSGEKRSYEVYIFSSLFFFTLLFHQMYRKQDSSFQKFQEGLGVNWNF